MSLAPPPGPLTSPHPFLHAITAFTSVAGPSRVTHEGTDMIPTIANAFWTSGQRAGHPLHEISYRACYKPQLPHFLIERLTDPGAVVYDPFGGRGTTLIEAGRLGRRPEGNDITPLFPMLARPRLQTPTLAEVQCRLAVIPWGRGSIDDPDMLVFYHPATLAQLGALRAWLGPRDLDPIDDWIRMVALSRLSGHSSGFFSAYTLPPNQAVSLAAQRRINARRNQQPPNRDVPALILRKSKSLLRQGGLDVAARFHQDPAWNTPGIADASVDLVVTSPPFLDTVDYATDNWLRGWFAGVDMRTVPLSQLADPAAWQTMMRKVLGELARVVRAGGHVAIELGDVRQGTVKLDHLVWEAAGTLVDHPFERLVVMVNQQTFTKTAHIWGTDNNAKGTNTNRIVLLRRR